MEIICDRILHLNSKLRSAKMEPNCKIVDNWYHLSTTVGLDWNCIMFLQLKYLTSQQRRSLSIDQGISSEAMERRPGHLVAVLGCLLHLICTGAATSNNVDTLQPILRTSPVADETTNGYFGYSLVLHQVSEVNSGDMNAALSSSR